MSSYQRMTKHPKTKQWEKAFWIDDLFEHHHYGVFFPSEVKADDFMALDIRANRGKAHDPEKVKLETREYTEEEVARFFPKAAPETMQSCAICGAPPCNFQDGCGAVFKYCNKDPRQCHGDSDPTCRAKFPERAYVNVTIIKGETFRLEWDSGKKIDLTHGEWMALRRAQNALIFTEPV